MKDDWGQDASVRAWQARVAALVAEHDLATGAHARLVDLVSEVGELAKDLLEASAYGRVPFRPGDTWAEEMGDVFFSLLCLANGTGVDLETSLATALQKYERRLAARGTPGSGKHLKLE